MRMSSPAAHFDPSRDMGIYEPFRQITQWVESLKDDITPNIGAIAVVQEDARQENRSDLASHESTEPSGNDQEANRPVDRTQRRLAQNREAARKSRLRKKAYVQQLETSRLKLAQLEQELERARQQGIHVSSSLGSGRAGYSSTANSAIAAFEMEYGHWVEEQYRKNCELRTAIQAHIGDIELRILVDNGLSHYYSLFRMKADATKADVFYLMSGMWRTSAERFFLWIGGFRPSELLNVLLPQLEPLTEQQGLDVQNLRHSSQQTEDALSQGVDKLQQSLAQDILAASINPEGYGSQMAAALEKLEALEGFVSQADHLRSKTLQQMYRILTTRQAARGLLALGEYFHRLRALSSLWAARPREPA